MAARFWVGGTGNWDAADTTHWAASSGGSGGETVPGSGDTVTLDASSGGGTVTVTAAVDVTSITGGAHTGTLDTNGQTITVQTFSYTGTATRTLTLGASNITVTGASGWNISTDTNLTLSAASSTITCSGAAAPFTSGKTGYGTLVLSGSGTQVLGWGYSGVNLTRTGTAAKTDSLQLNSNVTCSGTFTCNGNSATNRILVQSNGVGTARTITAATVAVTNADFMDITGAGAGSWDLSAITGLSGDCGGNSGITFTTGLTVTWDQATGGNWSDVTKWDNTGDDRVPLPQDSVSFANAFSASQTVTADMPRLGKNIDWTGATGSPTWSFGITNSIFGSITLIAGMAISGVSTTTFAGRGSFTLTSAGKQWGQQFNFTAPGGSYTLNDALNVAASITITNGGFTSNNFSIQCVTISTNYSTTRSVDWGTSTITTISTVNGANVFNVATTTGLTWSGTPSVTVTGATANARNIQGGGQTYGTLTYTVAGSTGKLTITGSNSFAAINFSDATNARTLEFTAGTTTTIRNENGFNVQGTSGKLMTVTSATAATHTLSSTQNQTCDYLAISYSVAQGGGVWTAGNNSTNGGNNTGWLFPSSIHNMALLGVG